MHAGATHVTAAYNLTNSKGYQDDGEYGAGYHLLRMLDDTFQQNIAVFVVRVYGGTNLGPQRFECILDIADQTATRTGIEKK